MFRQSPRSRNVRNKGLKIKHVLQMSALFGASIWLLYQVQHTDGKKPTVTTNISENLHKDSSSNDMIKLGRKGLRPRGKETNVQDKKETIQHEADHEDDNIENEAEELLVVQGHDEIGENVSMNDGMEKNTKTGFEGLKEEMKRHENEEAKEKEDGVEDEKIKTDGMKQTHDEGNGSKNEEAIKEANRSKKSIYPSEENNKESRQESKYEEKGRKKEVKEEKEDGNEMQPNPNEVVEIASPPEDDDDDDDDESGEENEMNDNRRRRKENGEIREENESQSGSNPIHSKHNEDDKDSSSNMEKATEEETNSSKFVKNRKIGNLSRQRMWIKSVKKKTNPVPSFEHKKNEVK